ncbi:MAG TPA: hypothetical protein VI815_04030 [Candidatus Nanoarchaeia archaeon]|nr:hypothetical protein [Candidatus Nanoarchaeia archaeon]
MKTQERINEIEEKIIERVRSGYTHLKYANVYELMALRWVLEKDLKGEQGR